MEWSKLYYPATLTGEGRGHHLRQVLNILRKSLLYIGMLIAILPAGGGCTVSYKFEGGSINYDLTKTIHISDFPNRTSYSPTLSQVFNIALRKRFIEQTRLKEVTNNADIELEGEIVGFNLQGMAVKEDAYSSTTRLTINVRVNYVNNKESGKNLDRTFSAFKEFESSTFSDSVQDQLAKEIVDEIVDMIYNETVANW